VQSLRKLSGFVFGGSTIVAYFAKKRSFDPRVLRKVKSLYIKGIRSTLTKPELQNFITMRIPPTSLECLKNIVLPQENSNNNGTSSSPASKTNQTKKTNEQQSDQVQNQTKTDRILTLGPDNRYIFSQGVSRPMGHAFIHFRCKEAAGVALQSLDGQQFEGKPLHIEWALPKDRDKDKDGIQNGSNSKDNIS
ncbi:MAG: hypothetical protein EZS28_055507, partial [Streblomastix strix]